MGSTLENTQAIPVPVSLPQRSPSG